jgi:hypothetical protein
VKVPFPFRFRFVSRWKRKRNGKLSFPKIEKRNGNETELSVSFRFETETVASLRRTGFQLQLVYLCIILRLITTQRFVPKIQLKVPCL